MTLLVEAFVLVERVDQTDDGRPVLHGIYGPVLAFTSFPSEPFDMHLYARLREVRSIEDALELQVVMTHGATGEEWGRKHLFTRASLGGRVVTPASSLSNTLFFPPTRAKRPDLLVYKLMHKEVEVARTMLELQLKPVE